MNQEDTSFSELNLSEPLLKALQDLNFLTPSPIQSQTIPVLLQKRDLIGQAQTGTGKTAAFALPILESMSHFKKEPQALILTPTRELAIQVAEHFSTLSKYLAEIKVTVLCGGQAYRPQLQALKTGTQIIVGTPGRILDHLKRGTLNLDEIKTFILDEADEMLRMGFIEDVELILERLPSERHLALFSATMPSRIRQIANRFLKNPALVEIKSETATVKNISQKFIFASQHEKPNALSRLLAAENHQGVIVFVRTKSGTEEVADFLQKQHHRAFAIHGDLAQPMREKIIGQFRQGSIDVLVATDVAARGLDVDRVTHVINYDMAHDCETYVHRIGRTGRAGRSGVTVLFVTPKESRMLNMIERHTRQKIEKITIPSDEVINLEIEKRFLENIDNRLQHPHLPLYRKMLQNYLKDNTVDSLEVAAALALFAHGDKPLQYENLFTKKFKEEQDGRRNASKKAKNTSVKSKKKFADDYPQEIYRVDVGHVHGVKPGNIVGAIANEGGLQSRYITGLKIHNDHSIVRLPKGIEKDIIKTLNKAWVCGRQLNLTSLGAA